MENTLASFNRRFAAFAIDCFILEGIRIAVSAVLSIDFDLGTFQRLLDASLRGDVNTVAQISAFILIYSTAVLVLWGIYFVWFLGATGQTPGKKLMGIKVIRTDQRPMDFKTSFNRFVGYNISGGVLLIGFLWALFDPNKQTWHDKMAKTLVIKITLS